MKRNKKSFLNAFAGATLTMCNGLCALVFTKYVLRCFGSDFNGLNSTANQIVTILSLLEGGFTIATNVALFRPYSQKDHARVNAIISATNRVFHRIGAASLCVGILLSAGYSAVIRTELPRGLAFFVFFCTLCPICFNFYYATKYRILLQAEQTEYVISFMTLATNMLGYILNILVMQIYPNMWLVRIILMVFSLLNSLLIGGYVRKKFPQISYREKPDYGAITGTKDVFAQKLAGVIYSASPIICITLTSGGTMLASVYAVYNSVFSLLKGMLHAVIDAPRLGIGELAAQDDKERLWDVFEQYEFIIELMLPTVVSTAVVMMIPFVTLYTAGVTDIDYIQPYLTVLLGLICYFELLHIPSGHLLNMSGQFRISKNFQFLVIGILVAGLAVSFILQAGIIGILITVFIAAVSLCVMEITYIHNHYFSHKCAGFIKKTSIFFIVGIGLVFAEMRYVPLPGNYLFLLLIAAFVGAVNLSVFTLTGFILDARTMRKVIKRALAFVSRR